MSGAAATKERLYAQLASKLGRLSAALGETSRSMETLRADVHAMQVLAGLHGSQFMAVARIMDIEEEVAAEKLEQQQARASQAPSSES
ncbi:hypothetical protein EXIGLDRAFT_645063 [Exidia glandulosa HHB12029]|uniref:Uncharacterized protein n=1 Tax=Exidia glandulosa HHB12029 TaxID=1314781 RepID=A0A165JAS3_EXIGL|nr:hypothetical protein EXIGLDRAFT_645063 [Exidia glandulosa HHB12029]